MHLKAVNALTLASFATLASPSLAATPTFQVLLSGPNHIAITQPQKLLTTTIDLDGTFPSSLQGMAHDPISGKVFVVARRLDPPVSYLGEVDFTTGAIQTVGSIPGEVVKEIAFDESGQLFGLTGNREGLHLHSLLAIDKTTAAATLIKSLDTHGGNSSDRYGALAWSSSDRALYYSDEGSDGRSFFDKLAPGTFAQTTVMKGQSVIPQGMAFAEGRLWVIGGFQFFSADANNYTAGLRDEGFIRYPTPAGSTHYFLEMTSIFPIALPCIPSPTTACVYNRFKIEVAYDAEPQGGSGPAAVVLESRQSVKFTFFDPGNIELIIKVLDACSPPFNKWWLFAGGLTNVGVSIKVTDSMTGAVRTYRNPKGKLFEPISDTSAFDCL